MAEPLLSGPLQLVEEIDLGAASRPHLHLRKPVTIQVVRELTYEDLPAIMEEPILLQNQAPATVRTLRYSHHRLAEMIARGMAPPLIALATGYSTNYIKSLMTDPAFNELLAHYEANSELLQIDLMERLKTLGIDGIEKLQEKLDDPEVDWSKRELMELVELAKPVVGRNGGGGFGSGNGGGGVALEVKFVGATPRSGSVQISATQQDGGELPLDITPRGQTRG